MIVFSEGKQHAGAFDFTESVYTPQDLSIYREYFDEKYTTNKTEKQVESYYLTNWRTFEMSDHLPLWIELKVDFSNQYLKNMYKTTPETSATSASNTCVVEKVTEKPLDLSYVGNKNSKTFHLASCRSLPAEDSRVYFSSQQAAIDAGYKSCGICKP
jgi:hypothetical protein